MNDDFNWPWASSNEIFLSPLLSMSMKMNMTVSLLAGLLRLVFCAFAGMKRETVNTVVMKDMDFMLSSVFAFRLLVNGD